MMSGSHPVHRVLARRIRELAAAQGISLARLANDAGVSRSHLGAVLSCTTSARVLWVARVAGALGVGPDVLLEDPPRRRRRVRPTHDAR